VLLAKVEWQGWVIDVEANSTLGVKSAVERALQLFFLAALQEVPRDTGNLADSIFVGSTRQIGATRFSGAVLVDINKAPYYLPVIRGWTSPIEIDPHSPKFKVLEFGGKIFSSYTLPPRPPNPFHVRAYEREKENALTVAGVTFRTTLVR
jgi:hypothetical protein